ncbi:NUDIX hydrolase [Candidatus Saccharibacteria bacterium]|nr:NUDIX hydrolase [Candidatus Saccharibacteria bacterium]
MKNWHKYLELVRQRPQLFTKEALEVVLDEKIISQYEKDTGRQIGVIYESPWRYLVVDLVCDSGNLFAYERVIPARLGGVAILPVYNDNVVLIREYRHPVNQWRWEIPRGFGTVGVSAVQNARKELFEETGINNATITHIGIIDVDSGLTSDQVDLFLAKVKKIDFSVENKEECERIEAVKLFTMPEIQRMIIDHEIVDSFTLSALYTWKLHPQH